MHVSGNEAASRGALSKFPARPLTDLTNEADGLTPLTKATQLLSAGSLHVKHNLDRATPDMANLAFPLPWSCPAEAAALLKPYTWCQTPALCPDDTPPNQGRAIPLPWSTQDMANLASPLPWLGKGSSQPLGSVKQNLVKGGKGQHNLCLGTPSTSSCLVSTSSCPASCLRTYVVCSNTYECLSAPFPPMPLLLCPGPLPRVKSFKLPGRPLSELCRDGRFRPDPSYLSKVKGDICRALPPRPTALAGKDHPRNGHLGRATALVVDPTGPTALVVDPRWPRSKTCLRLA